MTPKRALITAAVAVLALTGGVVYVAQAATVTASCTPSPVVSNADNGTAQKITVVCKIPKPPPTTVTATETITATATETVTTSPTASPTASQTPTVDPTPTVTPTPTSTPTPGVCAVTTANVPDGPDGNGGCFPGLSNTGPDQPASAMATYTGPCTITTANVVIDSQVVNCRTLDVRASGLVLRNSYLFGGIIQGSGAASFTVVDSLVDSGVQYPACSDGSCPAGKYACGDTGNQTTDCGVTGSNFTIQRTEIINSNRAAYCFTGCLIEDSYFHGTNLWPDVSNRAHASSVREEQSLTLRHNSLHCSFEGPFVNSDIGCSADLTGYPDFTAIKNNTVDSNLFVANAGNVGSSDEGASFCAYGGNTGSKEFSNDPTNATNQKFTNNVFQRGWNNKCAAYGAVTDFALARSGNVWSGNVWDDGASVPAN